MICSTFCIITFRKVRINKASGFVEVSIYNMAQLMEKGKPENICKCTPDSQDHLIGTIVFPGNIAMNRSSAKIVYNAEVDSVLSKQRDQLALWITLDTAHDRFNPADKSVNIIRIKPGIQFFVIVLRFADAQPGPKHKRINRDFI